MSETPATVGSVVIVGYGAGVAAGAARAFGARGHALALIARDGAKLKTAAAELDASGYRTCGFAADASDEASLASALIAAREAFGDPVALLYNAAYWRPGPALALTPEDLVADFRVCVAGALSAARAVVPAMRAAKRGSLLFTGGGLALHPSPQAPALSIGKAGIRALALILAQELAPAGIRVGTVTILGTVEPGTSRDPDRIAAAFLALHDGPPNPATAEVRIE